MELTFGYNTVFAVVMSVVLIFFIVKIFGKIVKKILVLAVVLGLGFYLFFYSNSSSQSGEHKKYSIDYLKEKMCSEMITAKDTVYCSKILTPIYDDIKSKYSNKELLELEKNPVKYFKILNEAIKNNKEKILRNLAKDNQQDLWNNFINDVDLKYPNQKIIKQNITKP